MTYRLIWGEHWSTKRESLDPRVLVRYEEEEDGYFRHEYIYYFNADSDEHAREKAREYVKTSQDDIEVFSVLNRETKEVILTEEEQ